MLSVSCLAQSDPLIDTVRAHYASSKNLSASYELSIFWKIREKIERSSGSISYSPGDKFRVDSDRSAWASDGRTFWQYNRSGNQVIIKNLLDVDVSMLPSQILKTYLFNFKYAVTRPDAKTAIFKWTRPATDKKTFASAVTMWIDAEKGLIEKILIVDGSGNESTYQFKKTKTDAMFTPDFFVFIPPTGAVIVDTRE
jgi:outer membrane lipoprotein-sorting protein